MYYVYYSLSPIMPYYARVSAVCVLVSIS